MEQVIQLSEREVAKTLPIMLGLTPGFVLPNRIYVLSVAAVKALHEAGITFRELSRNGLAGAGGGIASGERA